MGEKLASLSAEQIREYYTSHGLEYNDANGEYLCEEAYINEHGLIVFGLNQRQKQIVRDVLHDGTFETDNMLPEDIHKLGLCYYYGFILKKDFSKAFYYYSVAAERLYAPAERCVAICYKNHFNDIENAALFYLRAAKHGDAKSQCSIAEMCYNGIGVEKNEDDAWSWMAKAVQNALASNDGELLNYVGDRNHYGDGMFEVNLDYAAGYYRKAAEFGFPLAKLNLALMMQNMEISGSDEEIETLLSEAAEPGFIAGEAAYENYKRKKYGDSVDIPPTQEELEEQFLALSDKDSSKKWNVVDEWELL